MRGRRALIVSGLGWLDGKDDTIARQRTCAACFFCGYDGTGIPRVDYYASFSARRCARLTRLTGA